ncbi:MAG: hypothetical protein J7M25_01185 [Deltaproteobacteria bacterium]|nr:hypothetical protein [Deltaproteobacteria bacterium]
MLHWIAKQSAVVLVALLSMMVVAGGWTGCEDKTTCRQACLHTCQICRQSCDEQDPSTADELKGCEESCQQQGAGQDRLDCVMATDACEDLWKC